VHTTDRSKLTQIQGTINRDFLQMPGGQLNIAVGAAYRFESVNQPSANPDDAYYGINAVSTAGSRRVYSGFYEVTAPILPILKLKADGRYDSYSSGQSNFSPKFEASSSRSSSSRSAAPSRRASRSRASASPMAYPPRATARS
jgi:iron complex outermembrane receptor protein